MELRSAVVVVGIWGREWLNGIQSDATSLSILRTLLNWSSVSGPNELRLVATSFNWTDDEFPFVLFGLIRHSFFFSMSATMRVFVSVYVYLCVDMRLCVYGCVCVDVCLCLSMCVYMSIYVCLCVNMCLCVSMCLCVCLSLCVYVSICVHLNVSQAHSTSKRIRETLFQLPLWLFRALF